MDRVPALPFGAGNYNREILQDAIRCTKPERQVKCSVCTTSYTQIHIYYDTSVAELKVFIGLLYSVGIFHSDYSILKWMG